MKPWLANLLTRLVERIPVPSRTETLLVMQRLVDGNGGLEFCLPVVDKALRVAETSDWSAELPSKFATSTGDYPEARSDAQPSLLGGGRHVKRGQRDTEDGGMRRATSIAANDKDMSTDRAILRRRRRGQDF